MKKWMMYLLIVAVLGIVTALLVYKYVINKSHPDYAQEEAAYTISAEVLFKDYTQNHEQAKTKYTGQVLAVTGAINRIEEVDSLVIVIFVFDEGMFGEEGVRITMLPDYAEMVKQWEPGKTVGLKGFCTGYNETDVILEKGSIVE